MIKSLNNRISIVFMLFIGCLLSLAAQQNLNRFTYLPTPTNEFEYNVITSITQDSLGFMWFGSAKGLYRYDGVEIKGIDKVNNYLSNLSQKGILALEFDSNGLMWFASLQGVFTYDTENEIVNPVPIGDGDKGIRIHCLYRTLNNDILIGTTGQLYVFKSDSGILDSINLATEPNGIIKPHAIFSLSQKTEEHIWVGTSSGLYKLFFNDGNYNACKSYRNNPNDSNSLVHDFINSVLEDKNGNLWIGTSNGLDLLEKNKNTFFHYSKHHNLVSNDVRQLICDSENNIWIGTDDGISVIHPNGKITQIKSNPYVSNSLSDNKIKALYAGEHGTIWVGTYFGGVNYRYKNYSKFSLIDEYRYSNFGYKVVSCLHQGSNEDIYIGTEGGGVSIFNPSNRSYRTINRLDAKHKIGTVKSIFTEGNCLWICTPANGLLCYNLKSDKLKQFTIKNSKAAKANSFLLSMEPYTMNRIWLGTLGTGLALFNSNSGEYQFFEYSGTNKNSISGNSIRSLLVDKNKNLWIGTQTGLCFLNKNAIKNNSFHFKRIFGKGIDRNIIINDICEDKHGQIWIGTTDNALLKVENKNLLAVSIAPAHTVFSILHTSKSKLWLSTDVGIVSYNTEDDTYEIFNKQKGLIINEFNKSVRLLTKDGKVYFGGASGITSFDPSDLAMNQKASRKVRLVGLSIYNNPVVVNDNSNILSKRLEYLNSISLEHTQNMFTIKYALPDFRNPTQNKFQYRLLGFDNKWVKTSMNEITYSLQKAGTYIFEIRNLDIDNNPGEITKLQITLTPPWWKSWWAYMLYLLLISFVLYSLFVLYRSKSRLKLKLNLELKEKEQQTKLNEEKLKFFTNISHDFKTPLTLIIGSIQHVIDKYKGSNDLYKMLLTAKNNSDHLLKLINELMDFRKLESEQMNLSVQEENIVDFVKQIYLSFKSQAELQKYEYTFSSNKDSICVYFDTEKLERVFYNLLSNAFKFTPEKGTISVKITEHNNDVDVEIVDDGIGIAEQDQSKIFERFYEVKNNRNNSLLYNGTGIGLTISKNIVELHKGHISVKSKPNEGSVFKVTIPLGKMHFKDVFIKADSVESSLKSSTHINGNLPLVLENINVDNVLKYKTEKRTVLIAEDNPDVAVLIKQSIEERFNTIIENNGLSAYKTTITKQPDLIISDIMMPVMDGIEFCKKIKSNIETSHIPFLLLTAKTSLESKYNGLESGADEYLSKPFDVKELLLKCQNILQTRENLIEKFNASEGFTKHDNTPASIDEVLFYNALQLLEKNIDNVHFRVDDLCELVGISRRVLYRKFNVWTNKTPHELFLELRLKRAAKLIEDYNLRISEVAYGVGFKDPKYFSKSFKKFHGLSPREYAERFFSK